MQLTGGGTCELKKGGACSLEGKTCSPWCLGQGKAPGVPWKRATQETPDQALQKEDIGFLIKCTRCTEARGIARALLV